MERDKLLTLTTVVDHDPRLDEWASSLFSMRETSSVHFDASTSRMAPADEQAQPSLREYSRKELHYYADYDPLVGYRIAVTLGLLILLFIIFVLYKTHCHAKRNQKLIQNASAAAVSAMQESTRMGRAASVAVGVVKHGKTGAEKTTRAKTCKSKRSRSHKRRQLSVHNLV